MGGLPACCCRLLLPSVKEDGRQRQEGIYTAWPHMPFPWRQRLEKRQVHCCHPTAYHSTSPLMYHYSPTIPLLPPTTSPSVTHCNTLPLFILPTTHSSVHTFASWPISCLHTLLLLPSHLPPFENHFCNKFLAAHCTPHTLVFILALPSIACLFCTAAFGSVTYAWRSLLTYLLPLIHAISFAFFTPCLPTSAYLGFLNTSYLPLYRPSHYLMA